MNYKPEEIDRILNELEREHEKLYGKYAHYFTTGILKACTSSLLFGIQADIVYNGIVDEIKKTRSEIRKKQLQPCTETLIPEIA